MTSAVVGVGFATSPSLYCPPKAVGQLDPRRPLLLPLQPRLARPVADLCRRHRTCPVAVTSINGPPRQEVPPAPSAPATAPAAAGVGWPSADATSLGASHDAAGEAEVVAVAAATASPSPPSRAPPGLSVAYLWPRALLLGVAAIWGTNFGTVKLIQSALPASAAAGVRFGLAAAALSPALIAARRQLSPGLWREGVVAGLWVFAGYATQSIALEGCHANTSAFLCSLAVALGASAPITLSDAFALFQAVAFGMGFILNERAMAKYPDAALPISAIQLLVVAALSVAWALTDSSTWTAAGGLHVVTPDLSPVFADTTIGGALVYAGLITTAATVVAENIALVRVSAAEMSVLLATEPLWAAMFSAVLLGESMGPTAAAGGALILAACLVSTLLKGKGDEAKES
ncbi:hypothetical protein MMPV_002857 [Pyropia vietnamensis]